MNSSNLHGIIPYLVTPIDPESGRIRSEVLSQLVNHLISKGVHGLSPLGSTGEVRQAWKSKVSMSVTPFLP